MQSIPFSLRMQMKKEVKVKGIQKTNNKKQEVKETAKSMRQIQKKQIMIQLVEEKCIRVPNLKLAKEFNPNNFIQTLTQIQETQAEVIPFYQQNINIDVKPSDIKAQIYEDYKDDYVPRLQDLFYFCQQNVKFTEQTLDSYRKKAVYIEKATKSFKKLKREQSKHDLSKSEHSNDEFDDTETKYNVKVQLKPQVIFLTHNTNRIMDIQRIFRKCKGVYPFFTRHYPISAVLELINDNIYADCMFMITQPHRALKLLQIGALDMSQLKFCILDLSYRDDKDKTAFEYEVNRLQLRVFCKAIQGFAKYWIL